MKRYNILAVIVLAILLTVAMAACGGAEVVTVNFIVDGAVYKTSEIIKGDAIVFPSAPSKENHIFIGWFDGKTEYKAGDTAVKDLTLSAKFSELELEATEGLLYTAIADDTAYEVSLGTAVATTIVIAPTYNGMSVTKIANRAFSNGPNIAPIQLVVADGGAEPKSIVRDVVSAIVSVIIPASVTQIGDEAFGGCVSLSSIVIPESVTHIGDEAFGGCSSLDSFAIPKSVTSIGLGAFVLCSSLTGFTVDPANSSYCALDGVLFNKTKDKLVCYPINKAASYEIPDCVTCIEYAAFACSFISEIFIPDSVVEIGDLAFVYCEALTSVVVPDSVTEFGTAVFAYCTLLSTAKLSKNITVMEYTFSDCTSLVSIIIPDGVTYMIGAFSDCASLASIIIPEGVLTIGEFTFRNCTSLTSLRIPESITNIDDYAFVSCSGLVDIEVAQENLFYLSDDGILFDKAHTTIICYPIGRSSETYKIPVGVRKIGAFAFANSEALINVIIPDSVVSIGPFAFGNCKKLRALTIGISVSEIASSAFENSPSLVLYLEANIFEWSQYYINNCMYIGGFELASENGYSFVISISQESFHAFIPPENVAPYREGYYFAGWNTSADGLGTMYQNLADVPDEVPLVFAIWIPED